MLHNFTDIVEFVKQISVDAVNASEPCNLVYGIVTNIKPLEIRVEQKLTLGIKQLVLTRNVTDFNVDMTVDHVVENSLSINIGHTHTYSGTSEPNIPEPEAHVHKYSGTTSSGGDKELSHNHKYVGRKTFKVHNGLVVGDKVVLLQMQGGQKYIVLDRVV